MTTAIIDPTHTVVFGGVTEHPNRERCVTAEAVAAAARRGDRLAVRLDDEGVAEAYPRIVERLRERYERTGATDDYREFATASDGDVDLVANLLRRPTWHLPVLVPHVRVERDGDPVVRYDAERRRFDLDADAAPACADAVAAAFDDVGAGVLPRRSLCRWTLEGTTYDLSPPVLRVDETGYELAALRDVESDPEDLSVRLRWEDDAAVSRFADLLGDVLGRLATAPPRELAFEEPERFEAATGEFERVLDAIQA